MKSNYKAVNDSTARIQFKYLMGSISMFPESPQRLIQRNRVARISDQDQPEVATFLHKAGQLLLSSLRIVNPPTFPTVNSQI